MRLAIAAAAACLATAAQAQTPVSPACALVTVEDLAPAMGARPEFLDGGPATSGASSCTWYTDEAILKLQLMDESFVSGTGSDAAGAFQMHVDAVASETGAAPEELADVGERAILTSTSGGETIAIMLVKGGKLARAQAEGLEREAAIDASRTIASGM